MTAMRETCYASNAGTDMSFPIRDRQTGCQCSWSGQQTRSTRRSNARPGSSGKAGHRGKGSRYPGGSKESRPAVCWQNVTQK
jgi:hypothetical protein